MSKREVCKQLDVLIEDEVKAVNEYSIFKHKFGDEYPFAIINSLAVDEDKHANLLREIKAQVCQD